MYRKLSIPVGVAMLAALALVGMLGIFAFNAAQPAQADGIGSATVSVGDSMTGAMTDYTFTIVTNASLAGGAGGQFIVLTPPTGSQLAAEVPVTGVTIKVGSGTSESAITTYGKPPRAEEGYAVSVPDSGIISGATVTIMIPNVMNPADAGMYDWMIDSSIVGGSPAMATVTIEDGGNGGNGGTTTPGMVDVSNAMVTARPDDPGDKTQITVTFETNMYLGIDESITVEAGDDLGVPSSISASDVSISGNASAGANEPTSHEVAAPRSVIVEEDSVAETFVITLFIGDMSDDDGPEEGLAPGEVRVTFRQGAGITNRTEGGSDDWFVKTSAESGRAEIGDVYSVPWTISLSSYGDSRGEEITVIGKGFKNGTTTKFWRDEDRSGTINTDSDGVLETVLCDAIADGNDIATCDFTLSNPPFDPGTAGNYVNAVDGRNKKAGETIYEDDGTTVKSTRYAELKQIELEPSMSVSPNQGGHGDSINVQLQDFQPGDKVMSIQFSRNLYICGGNASACPDYGTVGPNGSLSFSFDIPNSVRPGSQDLKIVTTNGDDNTTFNVGDGELQLSSNNVLPNQRVSISGSGFTKSSRDNERAYIGRSPSGTNGCGGLQGTISIGGSRISDHRINDGDPIEVTSGGTWSAPIDLPIDSSTTTAGTRELRVLDCLGGVATVDLTFPDREVTMTPSEGGVGTEVVISGKNFPVANDDGTDIEIMVLYDAGVDTDDDDVEPDAVGSFTVILEVPEDANIPSNNTVHVEFTDEDNSKVLETFTHRVPQGTVAFSATRGGEGSLLTITANGFARYTRVDLVEFGDREITPSPHPSTDTNGNAEFSVRIPGSDPGIYIIRVEIDKVVATSTFTVVSGSGVSDGAVETVLGNIISEDALDRVFRFDNTTKMWEWYISDPAFASTNNLAGLSSGDLVYIKVTKDVSADILGASITLTCTNAGTDTEDCWNLVAIP